METPDFENPRKDNLFDAISEEIRVTKQLVLETRRLADAAWEEAKQAKRQADASWELVVMTRNEIARPWWRKFLG